MSSKEGRWRRNSALPLSAFAAFPRMRKYPPTRESPHNAARPHRNYGSGSPLFFFRSFSLPFINRSGMKQPIRIHTLRGNIFPGIPYKVCIHFLRPRLHLPGPFRRKRLAGITPPGIHPMPEKPFLHLFPVKLSGFLIKGVIDFTGRKQKLFSRNSS